MRLSREALDHHDLVEPAVEDGEPSRHPERSTRNDHAASFDHVWSERFTSNASYGWARADTEGQRTADPTRSGTYATANLLWWFLPGRAWFGGEYLFGHREVDSGATGQASRIQFAFKFFIP